MKHVDMFGKEIKVGDFIVYGAVDGRSGTLRAGQVLELKETKNWSGEVEPKVFVKSWSNFRSKGWGAPDDTRSGRQKNVTLGFLDRLIVVPEEVVGEKVKKDLAGDVANYRGEVKSGD